MPPVAWSLPRRAGATSTGRASSRRSTGFRARTSDGLPRSPPCRWPVSEPTAGRGGWEGRVAGGGVPGRGVREPVALVAELPRRELDEAERLAVLHGRAIPGGGMRETGSVALFAGGRLLAVADVVGDLLKPRVVLAAE